MALPSRWGPSAFYAWFVPRSRSAFLLLMLLLVFGGGCSGNDDGQPAPAIPPVTAAPEDLRATDDQPGLRACEALSAAVQDGTLMEPEVVATIVTSAGSADGPVADAAQRLGAAHTSATAAQGTGGEPDAVAAVSAAGAEMLQVCDESGLQTVG